MIVLADHVGKRILCNEFSQKVTEIRELAAGQAASRQRLDDLFRSMLHRAFAGEL
jgi:hypothetical protein